MSEWSLPEILVGLLIAGAAATAMITRWLQARRRRFLAGYQLPREVRRAFAAQHPQFGESEIDTVALALRQYFGVVQRAGFAYVGMPSRLADDLWHHFILSTGAYQKFCAGAFGRFLHHHPEAMAPHPSEIFDGMCRTWFHACALEDLDPARADRLPLLFRLDALLQARDGNLFAPNDRRVSALVSRKPDRAVTGEGGFSIGVGCGGGEGSGCGGGGD